MATSLILMTEEEHDLSFLQHDHRMRHVMPAGNMAVLTVRSSGKRKCSTHAVLNLNQASGVTIII